MLLNAAQKFLIAVILLEIPFQLDAYLDYQDLAHERGGISGWNVSITSICLLLLYTHWLMVVVSQRQTLNRLGEAIPGFIYVAVIGLSTVYAIQMKFAMFELFLTAQALLVLVYIVAWVRTEKDVTMIVAVLLVGLLLESLVMIAVRLHGSSFSFATISARIDPSGRVGGTIGSPNGAASYLTLMIPMALGTCVGSRPSRLRKLAIVAFVFGAIAIVMTGSRGGWAGCTLALTIFFLFAFRAGRISPSLVGGVLLCGLAVAACFHGTIVQRLLGDDRGAAQSRIPLMRLAFEMIADHPLLGVGANNMAIAMKPYEALPKYREEWLYIVHNRYLQVFVETGLVGLLAFFGFLCFGLIRAWSCWKLDHEFLSPIALGLMSGMMGEMLHITAEVFSGRPLIQILWTFIALIVAMRFTAKPAIATSTAPLGLAAFGGGMHT